jgi:hypothetical protein
MLAVTVYQQKAGIASMGMVRDVEVGTAEVPLATLNDNMRDEWVRVLDPSSQPVGSLRLQADFVTENVLPQAEYVPLANAVWDEAALACINEVVPAQRRETLARTMLRVYRGWGMDVAFLVDLCWLEIKRTDATALLFRGNSLATKALDQHMKMYGLGYLRAMLAPCLAEIYASRYSCEIDPTRVREWEVAANKKRLLQHMDAIWNAVLFSLAHCPGEFKAVFHQLQAMAAAQYQADPQARYTVVSAAFFLRFVCPAVLNPKLFDVLATHPEDNAKRTLTLVAKILQNLANLTPFGQKEQFMEDCNQFIEANVAVMKSFIDNISVCSV